MNFTNVSDLNGGLLRYYTSSLSGSAPLIQLWKYTSSEWEDYPEVTETTSYAVIAEQVYDSSSHLQNGVVQMRIYKASVGNVNNDYYIDWIAVTKGTSTPSGEEVDPFSIHSDGGIPLTSDWNAGSYDIVAKQFNGTWNGSVNYYTQSQVDNATIIRDINQSWVWGVCSNDTFIQFGNQTWIRSIQWQNESSNVALILSDYIPNNDTNTWNSTTDVWNIVTNGTFAYTNNLSNYYLKTEIDTQGEVETIWGVTLSTDTERQTVADSIKTNVTAGNTSMKTYVDLLNASQDQCSEITGCVENALVNSTDVTLINTTSKQYRITDTVTTFTWIIDGTSLVLKKV